MTVRQLWVQSEEYNAVDDRLALEAMLTPGADGQYGSKAGIRNGMDFWCDGVVGGGMTATVTKGIAWVPFAGSIYLVGSDEETDVSFAAADPVNARYDLIVVQVYDAEAQGEDDAPQVRVITGTPSQTPVIPRTPDGALPLWEVRILAGSTAAAFYDRRKYATEVGRSANSWRTVDALIAPGQWGGACGLKWPKPMLPGRYLITGTFSGWMSGSIGCWTLLRIVNSGGSGALADFNQMFTGPTVGNGGLAVGVSWIHNQYYAYDFDVEVMLLFGAAPEYVYVRAGSNLHMAYLGPDTTENVRLW